MKQYSLYFAQAYGEGKYNEGTYSCTTQQQQDGTCVAGTGTTSGGNGQLTNTGIGIMAVVTLACLLIFIALVVRLWRRPKHTTAARAARPVATEQLSK